MHVYFYCTFPGRKKTLVSPNLKSLSFSPRALNKACKGTNSHSVLRFNLNRYNCVFRPTVQCVFLCRRKLLSVCNPTLQKSRGFSRVSFSGMYCLYMLYSSWKGALEGKPPCIRSNTDTIPNQDTHTNNKRWSLYKISRDRSIIGLHTSKLKCVCLNTAHIQSVLSVCGVCERVNKGTITNVT